MLQTALFCFITGHTLLQLLHMYSYLSFLQNGVTYPLQPARQTWQTYIHTSFALSLLCANRLRWWCIPWSWAVAVTSGSYCLPPLRRKFVHCTLSKKWGGIFLRRMRTTAAYSQVSAKCVFVSEHDTSHSAWCPTCQVTPFFTISVFRLIMFSTFFF